MIRPWLDIPYCKRKAAEWGCTEDQAADRDLNNRMRVDGRPPTLDTEHLLLNGFREFKQLIACAGEVISVPTTNKQRKPQYALQRYHASA